MSEFVGIAETSETISFYRQRALLTVCIVAFDARMRLRGIFIPSILANVGKNNQRTFASGVIICLSTSC